MIDIDETMNATRSVPRASELDVVLAKTRSLIDQTERLVATDDGIRTALKARDTALLTRSRACIAESKRLLAGLATPTRPDRNPATLSVRVFQERLRFGWTLSAPSKDVLGRGTAETERQARIDAFAAGMTYIDRANGRSSPGDDTRH